MIICIFTGLTFIYESCNLSQNIFQKVIMPQQQFRYIRANEPESLPQALGIYVRGTFYYFRLETFHIAEQVSAARGTPSSHIHKVFHIVRYYDDIPATNMFIDGEPISIYPGSLVLMPPEVSHVFKPTIADTTYDEITFSLVDDSGIELSGVDFSDLLKFWSGTDFNDIPYVHVPSVQLQHDLKKGFQLIAVALQNSGNSLLRVLPAITNMVYDLMNGMTGTDTNIDPVMLRAREFIESNYLKDIDLKKLAGKAGLSHEHFCKRFKREFDISPVKFRNELRINAAKQLLSLSELQITEIADRLGFSDVYTFSRAFKNNTGISPDKYRKRNI